MNTTKTLIALSIAAFAFIGGCESDKATSAGTDTSAKATAAAKAEDAKCTEPKAGTITSVNKVCVINPAHPVDPSAPSAEWNGKKIGFCCAGCVAKWNKMTDAQKSTALAAVNSK